MLGGIEEEGGGGERERGRLWAGPRGARSPEDSVGQSFFFLFFFIYF